jgi:ribosome recycling factor
MPANEAIKEMNARFEKTIASVKKDFSHIRTGRASGNIIEDVRVEYYDQQMPIAQLASISVPEPRVILIAPWDAGAAKAIEKSLQKANLGLGINFDGKVLRLAFPELTEDRRKEFVKNAQKIAEDGKVALRNIRRDTNESFKKLLKDKLISEDEEKRAIEQTQKLTDEAVKNIDQHLRNKEKEIMEV